MNESFYTYGDAIARSMRYAVGNNRILSSHGAGGALGPVEFFCHGQGMLLRSPVDGSLPVAQFTLNGTGISGDPDCETCFIDEVVARSACGIEGLRCVVETMAPCDGVCAIQQTLAITNASPAPVHASVSYELNASLYAGSPLSPVSDDETGLTVKLWHGETAVPALTAELTLAPGDTRILTAITGINGELSACPWRVDEIIESWNRRLGTLRMSRQEVAAMWRRAAVESMLCVACDETGEVVYVRDVAAAGARRALLSDIPVLALPCLYLNGELYSSIIRYAFANQPDANVPERERDAASFIAPAVLYALQRAMYGEAIAPRAELARTICTIVKWINASPCGLLATGRVHDYEPLLPYQMMDNALALAALRLSDDKDVLETAASLEKRFEARFNMPVPLGDGKRMLGGCYYFAQYRLDTLLYYEYDALELTLLSCMNCIPEASTLVRNTCAHMFSPLYSLISCRDTTPAWWESGNHRRTLEKHSRPYPLLRLCGAADEDAWREALLEEVQRACHIRDGRVWGGIYHLLMQYALGIVWEGSDAPLALRPRYQLRGYELNMPLCGRSICVKYAQGQLRVFAHVSAQPPVALRVEINSHPRHAAVSLWVDGQEQTVSPGNSVTCTSPEAAEHDIAAQFSHTV